MLFNSILGSILLDKISYAFCFSHKHFHYLIIYKDISILGRLDLKLV